MDHRNGDASDVAAAPTPTAEALEFVRFCHRRKRVGWPELYDEMCAVAGRGLYLGYGPEELAAIGIGFGLFQMPALANLVGRVVAEEQERRRLAAETVKTEIVVAARARRTAGSATAPDHGLVAIAPTEAGQVDVNDDEAAPAPASSPAPGRPLATEPRMNPEPAERAAPELGSIRIAVAAGA
jgi:hypothetical protein